MEYLLALVILLWVLARIGASINKSTPAQRTSPIKPMGKVRSVKKTHKNPRRPARWIETGRVVPVAGRNINGMIYLGQEPRRDSWNMAGSGFIDPNLSIAKSGSDYAGDGMPYWPRYSDISPRERATFLDWLASGRSDTRIGPGYVFLFFYGLERRFFVDASDEEEKRLLVEEVERLLAIYGENSSVRRYMTAFLQAARIVLDPTGDAEPRFERSGHELPLGLRVAIGLMAKERHPLSAGWLLGWYATHPETRFRTPAIRAFPEFRALFTLLFNDRFPKGLKIYKPKRLIRARYASASREFDLNLKRYVGDVPDISGTSKPVKIAKEIVDEATDSLDKFSRYLGRNPNGRDTIEAHALMPERLWPLFPCAAMKSLHGWADGVIEAGGLCPVEQVVEQLEGATPDKLGKRRLTGAADALARLSIGMAPDPRFALRSPKLGEPVVLFRLPEGTTAIEDVSEEYRKTLVAIAIGSFVAHADGKLAAKERSALEARIKTVKLSNAEQTRLLANLQWMLSVPPNLVLFRRRLKDVPEHTRHEFGQVTLAMAAVDGVIDPGEIKAIERLYKAIGLRADSIYSDIHAFTTSGEPYTVRKAGAQANDLIIPPPPEPDSQLVLDVDRVDLLMADTARVSNVLADIFSDNEPEETEEDVVEDLASGFPGLDRQHSEFLGELLTRPHWDEVEFATLADEFRLMQAGAVETLNEWSFERFGDVLIDEYEGYEINPDLTADLRS